MSKFFRFKSFTVYHDKCAMKVGTDAILLGAWASADAPNTILDIGTGTGIIGLMLAQRFPDATVHAVEIDRDASQQANLNFRSSCWADRLSITRTSIQTFHPSQTYDLVTCNPPYFRNSMVPEEQSRHLARHDDSLSIHELLSAAARLLSPQGNLCIILPAEHADNARNIAGEHNLNPVRRCLVQPTPSHPPKRHLLQFSLTSAEESITDEKLVIETLRHQYSPEFSKLAKDFLLKL